MFFNSLLKIYPKTVILRKARLSRNHIRPVRNLWSHEYHNDGHWEDNNHWQKKARFTVNMSALLLTTYLTSFQVDALEQEADLKPGLEIDELPFYTLEEVNKHNNPDESVWIVYKAGVYDVTKFVKVHPGGDYVLLAAGNSVEPFWEVYGQHKTQQVYKLLESFRIGNLRQEDRLKPADVHSGMEALEYIPRRNPNLLKHHEKPFNAETPLNELVKSFLTPNESFFIRNHLSVPDVRIEDYELEIAGLTVLEPKVLKFEDLKTLFPKHSVVSVVQCAGNRRESLNDIKEVKGIAWKGGAIGNAKWSGARLVDVLEYCGADLNDPQIKHVIFEGLDLDATSTPYGASVPADKALDRMNSFLIAYEMNDEPIPADHGHPVRLIAPGIVGARNVKWLGRIILSQEESDSHWQRRDYKSFPPNVDTATGEEFDKAYAIQELPIQSAICTPGPNEAVAIEWKPTENGDSATPYIEVKGYAWSGGGRQVIRVDISVDDGQSWLTCDLTDRETDAQSSHTYSWVLWRGEIPLRSDQLYHGRQVELVCRAWDSAYNTQPREPQEIWNFRGLLNNSWHRVRFTQK